MPRRDFTIDAQNAAVTDAAYRAAGKAISDALVAVGLNRTTAIDWNTVVRPASSGSSNNWGIPTTHAETFELTGTLQGQYRIAFELFYGVETAGQKLFLRMRPRIGAGTGWTYGSTSMPAPWLVIPNISPVGNATALDCVVASDGQNWVTATLGLNATSNVNGVFATFALERLRDAAGSYTARGAIGMQGAGQTLSTTWRDQTSEIAAFQALHACVGATTTSLLAGQIAVWPHNVIHTGLPGTVMLYGMPNEWTNNEEIVLDGKTYKALQVGSHTTPTLTGAQNITASQTSARHLVRVA